MSDALTPKFDFDYLRKLIELMQETGLDEVEMKEGESTVRLRKNGPATAEHHYLQQPFAAPMMMPVAATQQPQQAQATQQAATPEEKGVLFSAPMVGTFYNSPSPDADPFVKVGSAVKKGQTLCIIEAMKTFNQIEAEEDGVITAVLTDNGQPVEYGEPLFRYEKR